MEELGTIALVGSPSSGKSTLFNRLTDEVKEITGKEFGITRDRNYGTGHWLDKTFTLIDTGGITQEKIPFQKEVQNQVELAEKLQVSDKTISKWESGAGLPEISQFPTMSKLLTSASIIL